MFISIFIDILSKYISNNYIDNQINLIGDFLYLKFIENTGIAFSIQIPSILLKIITISLIILIFYYYKKEKTKDKSIFLDISAGLVIGGAIGNAIGRIFDEKVIDFIGVKYFAIFNLADVFISIGAILYIYHIYINKKV